MKKILLLIGAIAVTMTSCESKAYSEISKPVANPTYDENVKPVVDANCTGCHNGGQFPPLTNYSQVKDAALNGNFLCRINGTCGPIMPQSGKMNQATVDMINLWVTQGCVEK